MRLIGAWKRRSRRYHSEGFSPLFSSSSKQSMSFTFFRLAAAGLGALLLAGCESIRSWAPTFVQPYRPDVQQGNVVTKEMVDQLRESMSRDQVRFLLGTPLLTSVFHTDRWDYVYYLQRGNSDEKQLRHLVVLFSNDRLASYQSDPMPEERGADNLILGRKPKPIPTAPPKEPPAPVNIPTK
jgi:outer membrane protein assembly factor BamE